MREDIARGNAGVLRYGRNPIADLVAVFGNPLDDIATLDHIVFVMHDGRIVRREGELGC